jgi:hypothetical protein
MPFAQLEDVRIHYDLAGPANAPALVFSNSLGENFSMWDPQMPVFQKAFRVLRYDTRGHGQSSVTPGPYTIEQLARDVLALLDKLDFERVHFAVCPWAAKRECGSRLTLGLSPQIGSVQHSCENRHSGCGIHASRPFKKRHEIDFPGRHGTLVFRRVPRQVS